MKKIVTILIILFIHYSPFTANAQDSVTAKVIKTSEKTIVYKVNGYRFVSFDCKCDSLRRGMEFKIPKKRFDSLFLEAKPIRKRDIEN